MATAADLTEPGLEPPAAEGFSLRRTGRAALWLALASIVGQFTVLFRELFVASNAGTSRELDGFIIAAVVPTFVAGVAFGGAREALVPAYDAATRGGGLAAARRFAGGILTWTALISAAAMILTWAFASAAVGLAGPGFGPEERQLALQYLPVVLPIIVLIPIGLVLTAVCQAERRFTFIVASSVSASVLSVVATIGLWDRLGIWAIGAALIVNAATVIIVLAAGLWSVGSLPLPRLRLDRRYAGPFARHVVPLSAGSALVPFNLLADRAVASFLSAGGVSALRYGEQLVYGPVNAVSGRVGHGRAPGPRGYDARGRDVDRRGRLTCPPVYRGDDDPGRGGGRGARSAGRRADL